MVDINQAKMYSEIYEILEILGDYYKNKIPKKTINLIKESKLENYTPKYNRNIPLYKQKLDRKAVVFICMLHYNYWCTDEQEKSQIKKILKYNQKEKNEKYDKYKDKFKNNKIEKIEESKKLVPVKKGIIERIINYLKSIFK